MAASPDHNYASSMTTPESYNTLCEQNSIVNDNLSPPMTNLRRAVLESSPQVTVKISGDQLLADIKNLSMILDATDCVRVHTFNSLVEKLCVIDGGLKTISTQLSKEIRERSKLGDLVIQLDEKITTSHKDNIAENNKLHTQIKELQQERG